MASSGHDTIAASVAASSLPSEIGPYRVQSELGRGMMGVVYKAKDSRSGRAVALKVIRLAMAASDEQEKSFERRFVEEAQIVARLDHPGIVAVYEIGRDPDAQAPFIAFEYLQGHTLATRLEKGALGWKDALRIAAQVARALHHAHEQGVIHRDIKPANIMLLDKESGGAVKIMDFGLAKREAGAELTGTGQFLGTPLYMSPEQALGRKVDARTDIFSLGCVAYTMLTGRRAFEAESIPQVMNKVTYQHPPRPTSIGRKLPAQVDYLVARTMAKSPDDRYATAQAFAEDVEDVLAGKTPRHRTGWTSPALAAEGTMVSDGRAEDEIPAHADTERAEPARRRRGGAGPVAVLGLSMLALGAVLYSSHFWTQHIARLREPDLPPPRLGLPADEVDLTAPTAAPTAEATAEAVPTPAAATSEPAAVPVASTMPAATASPEPTAVATEAPTPAPTRVDPPRASASNEKSRLSVSFAHTLKSGTLRVAVDKDVVLEQALSSRVTKDLLVFKQRSGRAKDVLPVTPGRRHIRVEVESGRDVHRREIWAEFKPGDTRRLAVGLKGDNLSLQWR